MSSQQPAGGKIDLKGKLTLYDILNIGFSCNFWVKKCMQIVYYNRSGRSCGQSGVAATFKNSPYLNIFTFAFSIIFHHFKSKFITVIRVVVWAKIYSKKFRVRKFFFHILVWGLFTQPFKRINHVNIFLNFIDKISFYFNIKISCQKSCDIERAAVLELWRVGSGGHL